MSGKIGVAPCGHPGHHVTANYVTCDLGCDAIDREFDFSDLEEDTAPILCPHCRSRRVESFSGTIFGDDAWHCWDCSKIF